MNGKNLRMARLAKDVSLTELSRKVGISISQLSRFESNLRQPRVEELQRIAKALNMMAGDLAPEFKSAPSKQHGQPPPAPSFPKDIQDKLTEIAREDRRNPDQEIEWLIEQEWLKRKKIT